jgi:predicted lipoprotein with Yx(FWY)xxD motif
MRIVLSIPLIAGLACVLTTSASVASPRATASTIYVASSSYGPVLFTGKGRVLYAFTRDPRRHSVCSGACATAWPPFVVSGPIRARSGAKAGLVATIRRANGSRQVTYGGRPLYFYVGDRDPGQVLCQNVREFGGLWLVIRGNGRLVR